MSELSDAVDALKTRVRRLDGAMAEMDRARRDPHGAGFDEALRDFERDLAFVERAYGRVRAAVGARPGERE